MVRRRGTPAGIGLLALVVILLGAVSAPAAAFAPPSDLVPAPIGRLAFDKTGRSGDQVWVSGLSGGHQQRLGPGDMPLVSPSGTLVAAALSGSRSSLVVYGPGRAAHRFFKASRVGAQAAAWSPESRYLAVELFGNFPGKRDHDSGLAIIDTQTFTAKVIARGAICGASFSPTLPDRLVYGRGPAGSFCFHGSVNLFAVNADGSQRKQITTDGHSLNPIWGPTRIAFDRQRLRKYAPAYQVWLMNPDGSQRTQITHMRIPSLLQGLAPMQFSDDGRRLLTQYVGQDTSETWTIDLVTRKVRQLKVKGVSVTAGGMSRDGSTVLVDVGGFLNPPSAGTVEAVPFSGGPAKVLVRHAGFPSWNR